MKWSEIDALRDGLTVVLGVLFLYVASSVVSGFGSQFVPQFLVIPMLNAPESLLLAVLFAIVIAMLFAKKGFHALAGDVLSTWLALILLTIIATSGAGILTLAFLWAALLQLGGSFVLTGAAFLLSRRIKEG
ncbi:MAG: hypothetical protein KGI38_11465 [Thaumarchaeota archaeon]|nr:hypothetical protein [Nitrososphaerota archaeon]